jgi:NADH-quinone oxidoreductase subunit G
MLDAVEPADPAAVAALASTAAQPVSSQPFGLPIRDFYLTNPIARASSVMAELSALRAGTAGARAAAE